MSRRTHLRTRVLLLTGAFAIVLFAITFGLSYRAKLSQERWSRLIRVETEAIAKLEEVTRAQNSFRVHGGNYRVVTQLLRNDALEAIDTAVPRARSRPTWRRDPRHADLHRRSRLRMRSREF